MKSHTFFCFALVFTLISNQSLHAQKIIGRDPTEPAIMDVVATETPKKEESYLLQSIIISQTRRLALINSKFVKTGDMVGEAKVERINKNSVLLSRPGQKITIYLFDQPNLEE